MTILSWGHPCLSYTGEVRIVHSTSDAASPLQSKKEGSPLGTCWPCWSNAARDAAGPGCWSNAARDAVGLLCCDSTGLAYGQLGYQDPKILLCRAAFQPGSLCLVCTGAWGCSLSGAGLFPFVELHEVSTLLTSSACQSTVAQLLGVSFFLIWYHLQTCWDCTPSHNLQMAQRGWTGLAPVPSGYPK